MNSFQLNSTFIKAGNLYGKRDCQLNDSLFEKLQFIFKERMLSLFFYQFNTFFLISLNNLQ